MRIAAFNLVYVLAVLAAWTWMLSTSPSWRQFRKSQGLRVTYPTAERWFEDFLLVLSFRARKWIPISSPATRTNPQRR
jgi:hypothetical protein